MLKEDLDDMGELLGRRPATREEGYAALSKIVNENPAKHLVDLVKLFARLERRREYIWRPMTLDSAAAPFEPLDPRRTSTGAKEFA